MNALSSLWTAVVPSIPLAATVSEVLSLGAFALLAACTVALWCARDRLDVPDASRLGAVRPHHVAP